MENERIRKNSFSNYIISFFIYSILVWICHVILNWAMYPGSSVGGVLHGPYLPFTGLCILLVMGVFRLIGKIGEDIHPTPVLLVVLSCAMFGLLQYLFSLGFEGVFGFAPWDFSGRSFNINGRVCCESCAGFAVVELICVYILQPLLHRGLNKMNTCIKYVISALLTFGLLADIALTLIW